MKGFRFNREDVGRILSWAYRKFYLRPKYVVKNIINGGFRTIARVAWRAIKSYLGIGNAEEVTVVQS